MVLTHQLYPPSFGPSSLNGYSLFLVTEVRGGRYPTTMAICLNGGSHYRAFRKPGGALKRGVRGPPLSPPKEHHVGRRDVQCARFPGTHLNRPRLLSQYIP